MKKKLMLFLIAILLSSSIFAQAIDIKEINSYFDTFDINYQFEYSDGQYRVVSHEFVPEHRVLQDLSEISTFLQWYIIMNDIDPNVFSESEFEFVINNQESYIHGYNIERILEEESSKSLQLLEEQYTQEIRPSLQQQR